MSTSRKPSTSSPSSALSSQVRAVVLAHESRASQGGPLGAAQWLEAAEAVADGLVAAFGVLHGDAHLSAGAALARQFDGEAIAGAEAKIDALDAATRERSDLPFASDAAAARWVPELTASYYLGLAVGYRLAKGAR